MRKGTSGDLVREIRPPPPPPRENFAPSPPSAPPPPPFPPLPGARNDACLLPDLPGVRLVAPAPRRRGLLAPTFVSPPSGAEGGGIRETMGHLHSWFILFFWGGNVFGVKHSSFIFLGGICLVSSIILSKTRPLKPCCLVAFTVGQSGDLTPRHKRTPLARLQMDIPFCQCLW